LILSRTAVIAWLPNQAGDQKMKAGLDKDTWLDEDPSKALPKSDNKSLAARVGLAAHPYKRH
jgi:hypothetical protein